MPAYVGAVNVNSIGTSGVFNIGDTQNISPYSTARTFSGAGSFNTGESLRIKSNFSNTNVYDKDFFDQNQIANN
jgi:spore germination protein PA